MQKRAILQVTEEEEVKQEQEEEEELKATSAFAILKPIKIV